MGETFLDVSVIIPTFRREKELKEAVTSVLAIRDLRLELLVSDDSPERSAKATLEVFKDDRLHHEWMQPPSGGSPGRVRNHLAAKARGKYLYFLDDDDRVNGQALTQIIQDMDANNASVAVGDVAPFGINPTFLNHEVRFFEDASLFLRRGISAKRLAAQILFRNPVFVCSACVIRRDAFTKLQGFDQAMTPFEDTEFYLRAIRAFNYLYVPVPLLERRCGEVCLSSNVSQQKIMDCYQNMRSKYRSTYGRWEYMALRALAKVM